MPRPSTLQLLGLQAELLDAGASLVAPGGLLVYSTCSLERAENEDQVGSAGLPSVVRSAVAGLLRSRRGAVPAPAGAKGSCHGATPCRIRAHVLGLGGMQRRRCGACQRCLDWEPQLGGGLADVLRALAFCVQVSAFLARHGGEFVLEPAPAEARLPADCLSANGSLTMLPHVHGTDGAFAARLRRVGGSAAVASGGGVDAAPADFE